jgi:hypothetical protein
MNTEWPAHLKTAQAVEYLRSAHGIVLAVKTLTNWRNGSLSQGPKFYRFGSRIYYRTLDLDEFVVQEMRAVTPSATAAAG